MNTVKETETTGNTDILKTIGKWIAIVVALVLVTLAAIFFLNKEEAPVAEELPPSPTQVEVEPAGPTVEELQAKLAEVEAKAAADAEADAAKLRDHQKELEAQVESNRNLLNRIDSAAAEAEARIAEAKAAAEAETAALKDTVEKTLPGEARVVFETFDPAKHRPNKDQFTEEKKFTVEGDLPVFKVKSTPDRIKTEQGIVNALPVLTPNGQSLRDSGFVPKLESSNLKPYRLSVWWEAKQAYVPHWFAQ